ncbi:hypothetical protein ABPG74_012950 [Tetrahymena malaccensis]
MSQLEQNKELIQNQNMDGIPIKWYVLKSLSKILEQKLTESELYLESQINSVPQTYIRDKDSCTLKYLKYYLPSFFGIFASLVSGGCYYLHFKEVNKHYLQKAAENEIFLQQNPKAQNLFPAKELGGSKYPFKLISKSQQKLRLFICMGFFFVAGYSNGYANYKYNLINMNKIFYEQQYEKMFKQITQKE